MGSGAMIEPCLVNVGTSTAKPLACIGEERDIYDLIFGVKLSDDHLEGGPHHKATRW